MSPTLHSGDLLLVDTARTPSTGDLVVVRWPDRPVAVKRLLSREPDGRWWVERDSPTAGIDSFSHGAVPADGLLATAVARLWPRPARRFSRR